MEITLYCDKKNRRNSFKKFHIYINILLKKLHNWKEEYIYYEIKCEIF